MCEAEDGLSPRPPWDLRIVSGLEPTGSDDWRAVDKEKDGIETSRLGK